MNKWIAEFDLEDGDRMPEHMDLEYHGVKLDFHCRPLEQEPRKGHWVKEESIFGWDGYSYQCSECGRSIHLDTMVEDLTDYPYCHCGADMREVKE